MAMIATSDRTALATISRTLRIGRSTDTACGTSGDARPTRGPSSRPSPTYTSTGRPTVPTTPSGSRRKILISSQVSFQSPRSMVSAEETERTVNHRATEQRRLRGGRRFDGRREATRGSGTDHENEHRHDHRVLVFVIRSVPAGRTGVHLRFTSVTP